MVGSVSGTFWIETIYAAGTDVVFQSWAGFAGLHGGRRQLSLIRKVHDRPRAIR